MSDLATLTRAAPRGMITLRGDLASAAMKKAVKAATGQAVPKAGEIAGDGAKGAVWMSPDELLVLVPYDTADDIVAAFDKALSGQHYLAANVSDARAVFRVDGPQAAEVLARLCPVDLHAEIFSPGEARRTRMAQIAAAFWRDEAGFEVVCFRSVADYAETLLRNAATGAAVGALGV